LRSVVKDATATMLANQIQIQVEASKHISSYMQATIGPDEKNSQASKFLGDSTKAMMELLKLLTFTPEKGLDSDSDIAGDNDINLVLTVKDAEGVPFE
jgi:hypothetical protein